MTISIKTKLAVFFAVMIALGGLIYSYTSSYSTPAVAEQTFNVPTKVNSYNYFTLLSATTTTATSTNTADGGGYFIVAGAKNVKVYFSRDAGAGGNEGSTQFKVQISPNGTQWFDYNTLYQNVATNTPHAFSSFTLSGTTTLIASLRDLGFYAIRCVAVETTDGSHTCKAGADF